MKRVLAVCVVAALAAGCSSSMKKGGATTPTTAKAGGTVTLLTHDAFAASKDVLADFTKQTGYKVKLVQPGDAGVMVNEAILQKAHPVADAIFGIDNTFLTRALDAGILDEYTTKGVQYRSGVYVDPTHHVTTIDEGDVCLNVDTSYFGHNGHPVAPLAIANLIDPKYKNLTVVENAATSSPGLAFLIATIKSFGEPGWKDYWRQLRANGVRVVNDWTTAYETDFTAGGGPGDRPIVVSYASSPPADIVFSDPKRTTSRVGVVKSSCFHQYEFAGVLHKAGNPAGAKALVDFLATKRFQDDMPLQMFVSPVVDGAVLPPLYAKWTAFPANPFTMTPKEIGAHREEWIKEWTNIATR